MDPAIIVALITSVGALGVAGVGFWTNRRLGLPSALQRSLREEMETSIASRDRRIQTLETSLGDERRERSEMAAACERRIEDLTSAIVERDLIINDLYRRMGLPKPTVSDPRE